MTIVIDDMPKMNPERKATWVAALRSGDYEQGKGTLHKNNGGYCCLGVVCDLHSKTPDGFVWTVTGDVMSYDHLTSYAPDEVFGWLGLEYDQLRTPHTVQDQVYNKLGVPYTESGMLGHIFAYLNDTGNWTFEQIADFIETNC